MGITKKLILMLLLTGCVNIPEDRNNYWRMTEHEKAVAFESMQDLCWEDAHVIGFAAGYFGKEAWQAMLTAREKRMEERRSLVVKP